MAIKISQQDYIKKFGPEGLVSQKTENKPNTFQRIGGNLKQAGSNIADIFRNEGETQGQDIGAKATGVVKEAFNVIPKTGYELLPEVARKGLDWTGKQIGKGVMKTADYLSETPLFKDPNAAYAPEAYQPITNKLTALSNLGQISGDILTADQVSKAATTATKLAGKGVQKTIEKVSPAVGRTLKRTGESAYGVTVTPQEPTLTSLQSYQAKQPNLWGRVKNMLAGKEEGRPITEANTAARKGLMGTEWEIGVQAKRVANKLWADTIEPKLNSVKGSVNMKTFFSEVEKEIRKSTPNLTRRNALLEALQKVREDFGQVNKKINLSTLQGYKEGWAEFLPDATYAGKPIASSLKAVHNIMADKARNIIYKYVGEEGKLAYIDYGNLKSIMKAGIKSVGDPAKRSITREAWQAVMDKAVTPVATGLGKVLYRTGEGIEFFGSKGAKNIRDIVYGTTAKDIAPLQ